MLQESALGKLQTAWLYTLMNAMMEPKFANDLEGRRVCSCQASIGERYHAHLQEHASGYILADGCMGYSIDAL